jgi:ATP-dependent DNA ligase
MDSRDQARRVSDDVRRDGVGVRLLTRNGHDWAPRYPLIFEAVATLRVRSCLIDGEAVCCDDKGVAVFAKLRQRAMTGTCSCAPSTWTP